MSNIPELTVSEIASALKRRVEEDFGHVRVRGEVSAPKYHSSGHLYLTLKDENACLAGVCWRGRVGRLSVRPEEGMEVVAEGRLTTYAMQSKYQIVIEQVRLAGVGAILKMLEDRKKKLAAEGLFDAARKRRLPFLPDVIGVVTSPTGAVIRDILHRIAERFPCRVLVWPVAVQGENAAAQVASAIAGFNARKPGGGAPRPDLLIVARGGGALEDLLPFSEEVVVRAAAASRIPLISAVGHETDTTLIDLAADLRAPTPTAAAEIAVPVRLDLLSTLQNKGQRLAAQLRHAIKAARLGLSAARLAHPRGLIETLSQRLDERGERLRLGLRAGVTQRARLLERAAAGLGVAALRQRLRHGADALTGLGERLSLSGRRVMARREEKLTGLSALLESLSYHGVLARGFALVRNGAGETVTRAAEIGSNEALALVFADGERRVKNEE